MTDDEPARANPFAVRFGRSEILLGKRVWVVVVLSAAILVIGILVSPGHPWIGAGVAASGLLGAVLGAMFQATPIPLDFTSNGASAVRGLLAVADDVENARILLAQLAELDDEERVKLGLVDLDGRLEDVTRTLYVAMAEWESVAPGSLREVDRLKNAGREAFALLKRKGTDV